jgi:hypothetical protein
VVSITIVVEADLSKTLLRKRLSFLSDEWQTWHLQAIIGTPPLVPVPRNSTLRDNADILVE